MNILVTGAAGFIGGHLAQALHGQGHRVWGVDIAKPRYRPFPNDRFTQCDLRIPRVAETVMTGMDAVYCLAANMGGMGFIGLEENQFDIMHDNVLVNTNCARAAGIAGVRKVFYSSSACVYPESLQMETDVAGLKESDAYPASPDTEYGWEKLFSERLYALAAEEFGFDLSIARFHNIYGPFGSWNDGREKAPAALCRKVAEAKRDELDHIVLWGDGLQTRSFCYIDNCLEQIQALMARGYHKPLNIGTDRAVSINELAEIIMDAADYYVEIEHDMTKPQGVRGRNADLTLMAETLPPSPWWTLEAGIETTYDWIEGMVLL